MERWQRLRSALRQFRDKHAPASPDFEIVAYSEPGGEYPTTRHPGVGSRRCVYLFFDEQQRLNYVGKSAGGVLSRMYQHDDNPRIDRTYVDVVLCVGPHRDCMEELEDFLYLTLRPTANRVRPKPGPSVQHR